MRMLSASGICFVLPDNGSVMIGSGDVSGAPVLASTSVSRRFG